MRISDSSWDSRTSTTRRIRSRVVCPGSSRAPLSYAAIGDPTFIPMTTENHNYQFAGSVTKTLSSHSFKVGGGVVYRQFGVQQSQSPRSMFAFDVAPTRSSTGVGGDTWASWLLGYPSLIQRIHFPIHPENRTYEPSMFVQDDWRATSWLTVNLGLRYEIFTPTTEVEDRMSVFNEEAGKILVAGRDTTRTARRQHRLQRYRAARRVCGDAAGQDGPPERLRDDVQPGAARRRIVSEEPAVYAELRADQQRGGLCGPSRHPPEDAGSAADLEQRIDAGGSGAAAQP